MTMTGTIDILTIINREDPHPHEYFERYDGTTADLIMKIKDACFKLPLYVSEDDINAINDNLIHKGIYWFDENYCFEIISVVL